MMTDSERSVLSDMFDKYDDKVRQAVESFDRIKKSYLAKFDYSYDFGDWRDGITKKFENITPTQFEPVSKIRPKLKATYDEARKELQDLRSIPLKPKKLIDDFDDWELETALDDQEAVKAGKKLMQNLYGPNIDNVNSWIRVMSAYKSEGWGKAYEVFLDEYHNGLKEVMEAATHLNELRTADLSIIPTRWTPRFNDYIKTIETARIDVRGYERVYREIEGAYNIYKLASDKDLIAYGLDKLSFNTPHTIVEGFRGIGLSPTKWLGKKEFYDSFDKFVPCISLSGNKAYYWSKYKHVRIDFDGHKERFAKSEWYRKGLQYHEYGHAKAALQGNWENSKDFKDLFKKFYDDYNQPSNFYQDSIGKTRWKIEGKYWEVKYKYGDPKKDMDELFGAITDTLQSLSKDKARIDGFGHDWDYFANSEFLCLSEIIAHLSENYWAHNNYFKIALPRLYNEAMTLYKKFYKANLPTKR